VKRWIAYETDETGWPSDAFLVVMAKTRGDARLLMADAINQRRDRETSREVRARLSEIFIEAPRELTSTDPQGAGVEHGAPLFEGFTARATNS
jgi:hypothetical protein